MLKKFTAIIQGYWLPIIFGLMHSVIATIFNSLFENQSLQLRFTWGVIGFLGGFIIGLFVQTVTASLAPTYKHPSQIFIFSATVLFSLFFACPFFSIVFIPLKETNYHTICCETPIDYGATSYESVKFTMNDGIILSGWYVPPSRHMDSIIILIHGRYNDRRGTGERAKYLIDAGYGVFMYDQRGNGESTGEIDYSSGMSTDLLSLIEMLRKKSNAKNIGVVGLSMGAHAAINAVDINQAKFSAVWLDGLYPQAPKDLSQEFLFKEWMLRKIDEQFVRIVKWYSGEQLVIPRAITDILPSIMHTQIMLVAGGLEDKEGPANRNYATLNNDHIHSWIMPNGHHLTGPFDNSDEYSARLIKFFDDAFKKKNLMEN